MSRRILAMLAPALVAMTSCSAPTERPMTVGVVFETLQTEYWVASFEAIRASLDARGICMLQAISDGDANRQYEQVRSLLARGVDGIILAPRDARTVLPMIKAANRQGVPIVLYNRPPAASDARSVTVVADNYAISRATVEAMIRRAEIKGGAHKAMILIGNLADANAVERRRGFDAAVKASGGSIEVVAEIPTEWNQEKALAGAVNALQAHPDIDFVFTSSDFLFASLVSALKGAGKYKKVGEPGHVILGGFDGDATAYRMLAAGYLDADGVQDLGFESDEAVRAVLEMRAGKAVPPVLRDAGFVIDQANLATMAPRMWGATIARAEAGR